MKLDIQIILLETQHAHALKLRSKVIEKNIYSKKRLKKVQSYFICRPRDLKKFIKAINTISNLLGKEVKKPSAKENKIKNFMRNRFII